MQSVEDKEIQFEDPEFREDDLYFEDAILEGSEAKWLTYRGLRFKLNPGRRDEYLRKRDQLFEQYRMALKAHKVSVEELDRKALYKTMVEDWEVPTRGGTGKAGFSSANFVKIAANHHIRGFLDAELSLIDQFKQHDEEAEKN